VSYDLWFNDGVSILPVVTDTATEMRDRFDLDVQLLADPDGAVAEQYGGTERTSRGLTGIAATYVVDEDGEVRYEQVADHPGDRTYGNWVRYFIRSGYEDPFDEWPRRESPFLPRSACQSVEGPEFGRCSDKR